jgi:hypothetical protein
MERELAGVRWEGDWCGEVEEDQVFYGYGKRGLECRMRPIAGGWRG